MTDYKFSHLAFLQLLMTNLGIEGIDLDVEDPDVHYDAEEAKSKILRRFEEIKNGQSTAPKGHYNQSPKGLIDIGMGAFMRLLFLHIKKAPESRQVMEDGGYNLIMIDIPNFDNKKLGIAVKQSYKDESGNRLKNPVYSFMRYGLEDDWRNFNNRFEAQFVGDNS